METPWPGRGEGEVSGAVAEKALDILDEDPVCFQTGPEGMPHPFPPWGRMNSTSPLFLTDVWPLHKL